MPTNGHKDKKDNTIYIAIASVIVLLIIIFVLVSRGSEVETTGDTTLTGPGGAGREEMTDSESVSGIPSAIVTESVTEEASGTESESVSEAPDTTALHETVSTEPETTFTESQTDNFVKDTAFNYNAVPQGQSHDLSDLAASVFIGDSRTEGLRLYTALSSSGARIYANKGLAVNTIYNNAFVHTDDGDITALQAVAGDPTYDSLYISLGINELGWDYIDVYIQKYSTLIQTLKEYKPSADIYVQAILPVSEQKSSSDEIFTNARVETFNKRISEMCQSLGVNFLDVTEVFNEYGGVLPPDASGDGIHLNKTYCIKWLEYILDHRLEK